MAANAYTSGTSWFWPKQESSSTSSFDEPRVPGAFTPDELHEEPEQNGRRVPQETNNSSAPRRHYAPRTCRICLEVVLPTFEPTSEALPEFLQPPPKVSYISQDPESGRLLRPCKCKGSQRYVHEGCLQEWRHADPAYGRRNYWECPTCKYRYRLERMLWSSWITSTATQVGLTVLILFTTVFVLGFIADPIINMYIDPVGTLTTNPLSRYPVEIPGLEGQDWTLEDHFLKGLASLGVLGFIKAIFVMGPWQYYQLRTSGLIGGGRRGRGNTGRDRMENISAWMIAIGVVTFLWALWKGVRSWSRRTLEKASERVVDVQGDDDDNGEE